MKRSGSKLIAKAGSVKNISKAGFRFAFELQIESVDQMLGTSDVVVTWERGPKVVSTTPYKVNKAKRAVAFDGATLKQDVTMFKKKKTDASFEPKVFRLSVRQGSETGKAVGKIDLNFADYAEVPSFSKRIGAPLSSGSRLILRVTSRYLGEVEKRSRRGKKGSTDDDSSSVASDSTLGGANDKYSVTAAEELAERDRDEQDLDDLMLSDADSSSVSAPAMGAGAAAAPSAAAARPARPRDPPPAQRDDSYDRAPRRPLARGPTFAQPPSKAGAAGAAATGAAADRYGGTVPVVAAAADRTRANERDRYAVPERDAYGSADRGPQVDSRDRYGAATVGVSHASSHEPYGTRATNGDAVGGGYEPGGASRAEIERVRAENKALRRANDQLREQLAELENRAAVDPDARHSDQIIRELRQENSNLHRDVEELQQRLSREPVYADVVRDLRESKMALAIITMERDELQQTLRQSRGDTGSSGVNPIASRNML